MNKRGTITIYLSLVFVMLIIIVLTAIVAPLGVQMSTEFYRAGEDILAEANASIQAIDSAQVRTAVNDANTQAMAAEENNILVATNLYQYSWVAVLVLTALIAFIFTRRIVEVGSGGLV